MDAIEVPENYEISEATLSIYAVKPVEGFTNSSSALFNSLNEWDEDKITWINQPEIDYDSLVFMNDNFEVNVWEKYNVRSSVRKIKDGTIENNGFIIICYGYGGAHYYSSEYRNQELRPKLRLLISDNLSPKVDLLSPLGGDLIVGGTEVPITWEASDDGSINMIIFYYSVNSGVDWTVIDTVTTNSGSYMWKTFIPERKRSTKLKIIVYDNLGKSEYDMSDSYFYVDKPPTEIQKSVFSDPGKQIIFNQQEGLLFVPYNSIYTVTIRDIKGKKISTCKLSGDKRWHKIGTLSNGIFFVTLEKENKKMVFKWFNML